MVTLSLSVQFWLDTSSVNAPAWPRWMLLAGWVTLMHSSGMGTGLDEVALDDGLGDELAAGVAKNALSVTVVGVAEVVFAGVDFAWVVDGWAVELELGFAESAGEAGAPVVDELDELVA